MIKKELPGVGYEYSRINLKEMSNEEIKKWAKSLIDDNVVLIRDQELDEKDLIRIYKCIGRPLRQKQFFMHPEFDCLYRVTNRRDENGEKIGLFADKELDWHSNGNGRLSGRECCVALYCVEPGIDSITSFCDTRKAYNELPENIKEIVDDVDCVFKFQNGTFYDLESDDKELSMFENTELFPNGLIKPLVYTHPFSNERGLYFTFHYISKMWRRSGKSLDESWLRQYLLNWVFQEKWIYHHNEWKHGDLIFMDQFHSIHKRNEVKGDRFLYRTTLDYSRVLTNIND